MPPSVSPRWLATEAARSGRTARSRQSRLSVELRERETVKPLELFFDLVFVLGFTQCTALMVAEPTWQGIGRGMLVLAVLWWAWVGYAWLTSVIDPEEGAVRIVMFARDGRAARRRALRAGGVRRPRARRSRSPTASSGSGHLALYLLASRDESACAARSSGFAISTAVAVGLLVGASFLDGPVQAALWVIAILGRLGRAGGLR